MIPTTSAESSATRMSSLYLAFMVVCVSGFSWSLRSEEIDRVPKLSNEGEVFGVAIRGAIRTQRAVFCIIAYPSRCRLPRLGNCCAHYREYLMPVGQGPRGIFRAPFWERFPAG